MNTFIALLRGINVGGNHILPMKQLVELLEGLGLSSVKTYIQSGNVVFQTARGDASELSSEITAAIEKTHGFAPRVLLIGINDFEKAAESNPFPEGEREPKTLHFFFMEAAPDEVDFSTLASLKSNTEQFMLIENVFYLHAPDGIGRSKLVEKVDKALGVPTTARNWRTVGKILDMANAIPKTEIGAKS